MLVGLLQVLGFLVAFVQVAGAAGHPAFTDPWEAGPDAWVQGEYVGKVGGEYPIGIQVIALGESKFEGVVHGGGLPGAGWDGGTRFCCRGERVNDSQVAFVGLHGERLMFENPNFRGTITMADDPGGPVFEGVARMFLNQASNPEFRLSRIERRSLTLGEASPPGGLVLFDGSDVDRWEDGRLVEVRTEGGTERGLAAGTHTRAKFTDYALHLEFRTPFMPTAQGMDRGNSGVYLQNIWEIQIVDSFGWMQKNRKYERLSHTSRCGGLHEMAMPRVNMCLPPLTWQTYDIEFTAARVDADGNELPPGDVTVRHNGVVVQDRFVLPPVPPKKVSLRPAITSPAQFTCSSMAIRSCTVTSVW